VVINNNSTVYGECQRITEKYRFLLIIYPDCYILPSSTLKKDKVAVTLVPTGFPPLLKSEKMLYGNAASKYL
jgi:hypothetical protein